MSDIGLVWIREDFRIENNAALSYATQNHKNVIAFYIYNNNDYDYKREAQKWWLSKSLENFKKDLSNYEINFKYFKGNILNEFQKVTKNDKTPFKVFTPFWRTAEKIYLSLPPSNNYIVKKQSQIKSFFKNCIDSNDILPKKNWHKKFENYWIVSENNSKKILKNLIDNKIKDYGTSRDIPSVEGTSK